MCRSWLSTRRYGCSRESAPAAGTVSPAATGGRIPSAAERVLSGGWRLGIVVLVVFLLFTDKGTVTATDVKAGDCLKDLPASGLVITVNKYSPSAAAHPEVGLFVLYASEDSWGRVTAP